MFCASPRILFVFKSGNECLFETLQFYQSLKFCLVQILQVMTEREEKSGDQNTAWPVATRTWGYYGTLGLVHGMLKPLLCVLLLSHPSSTQPQRMLCRTLSAWCSLRCCIVRKHSHTVQECFVFWLVLGIPAMTIKLTLTSLVKAVSAISVSFLSKNKFASTENYSLE